jgi:parvulin-like peptidyl-prolyl isomerase
VNRNVLKTVLLVLIVAGCEDKPAPGPAVAPPSATPAAPAPSPPAPAASSAAPAEQAPPDAVAAQHILIAYRGAKNAPKDVKRVKADAKKLADEIVQKARGGADFSALVQQYSEDPGSKERMGSLGKFRHDAPFVKPFIDAAFALKVGQVSDAVETPFGFHVIKRNQ